MSLRGPALGFVVALLGCRYSIDPNVDPNLDGGGFTCANDADCGSGWHCNLACQLPTFTPYCLPDSECDPCPSLAADPHNCGTCGNECGAEQDCVNSACVGE
jgi:hypothetical protein